MRAIAFVTRKGGSGKSTLAMCLAVAAREAGERVFVIDMDPQRSLVAWGKSQGEDGIGVAAVTAAKLPDAIETLAKGKITLAIIDTAGSESRETTAAIKAADLCVIPVRPTTLDLWASEATYKAVKAAKREFAFVLNQCPPSQQSVRIEEAARTLEAMGALVTPIVAARVDYQVAAQHGMGVTELNAGGKAAQEMRDLWKSLKRRLGRSKAGAARKAAA